MSANFRASYTETLGKLETQYCKLMVSGLPALPMVPGAHPCPKAEEWGKKTISYRAGRRNNK